MIKLIIKNRLESEYDIYNMCFFQRVSNCMMARMCKANKQHVVNLKKTLDGCLKKRIKTIFLKLVIISLVFSNYSNYRRRYGCYF